MSSKSRLKPLELYFIKSKVEAGESYAAIARQLGLSRQAVRQAYLREVARRWADQ